MRGRAASFEAAFLFIGKQNILPCKKLVDKLFSSPANYLTFAVLYN